MTALYTPEPGGKFRSRRPRKDVAVEPRELRPSERLAHLEALTIAAELDAQGYSPDVITYRSRGECLVLLDGRIEATVIGLTTEPAQLETVTTGEVARRDFLARAVREREAE